MKVESGWLCLNSLHYWFKYLLIESPSLILDNFIQLGTLYISIIAPNIQGSYELTPFEQFIILNINRQTHRYKESDDTSFLNNFTSGFRSNKQKKRVKLDRESISLMDRDSFNEWTNAFLFFYTDCFRDFITYIADRKIMRNQEYYVISALSELFAVKNGMILNGNISLEWITKILSYHVDRHDPYNYDPFYQDKNFNEKLHIVIEKLSQIDRSNKVLSAREIENFLTLANYSKVNQPRSNIQIATTREENFEGRKSSSRKTKIVKTSYNPYMKDRTTIPEYDSDWTHPCCEYENLILFYIFMYLSYAIDYALGYKYTYGKDGKLEPPKTNLRVFAKLKNVLWMIFIIAIVYMVLFKSMLQF